MKLHLILFTSIFFLSICKPTEGLFESLNFQEYVDSFIDATKFKIDGILSLNDSSINRIWSYFKSKYGRAYKSLGK